MAIVSPGSLDGYVSAAFTSAALATKFIEAVNPVYYELDTATVHMIVDGHAWDKAALDRVANGIDTGKTVTLATAITLAAS